MPKRPVILKENDLKFKILHIAIITVSGLFMYWLATYNMSAAITLMFIFIIND